MRRFYWLLALALLCVRSSSAADEPARYKLDHITKDVEPVTDVYHTADGIYVVTEMCLELPVFEDAVLVWYGKDDHHNRIEFKNGKSCKVVKLLREISPAL